MGASEGPESGGDGAGGDVPEDVSSGAVWLSWDALTHTQDISTDGTNAVEGEPSPLATSIFPTAREDQVWFLSPRESLAPGNKRLKKHPTQMCFSFHKPVIQK